MRTAADGVHLGTCRFCVAQPEHYFCIIQQYFRITPDDVILAAGVGFVVIDLLFFVDELAHIVARAGHGCCGGRAVGRQVLSRDFVVAFACVVYVHDMPVIGGAVIQDIGVEAVVASHIRVLCIVSEAGAHAIFIHMVLRGRISGRRARKVGSGGVTIQFMAEARVVIAVVRVLYFKNGFLAVLGEEYVSVFLFDTFLIRSGYLYQVIVLQAHEGFVGYPCRVEHVVRTVVAEAQIRFFLILKYVARSPLECFSHQHESCSLGDAPLVRSIIFQREDGGGSPGVVHDGPYHFFV